MGTTHSRGERLRLVVRAQKEEYSNATKLRSEAQAPFRTARTFLFGGLAAAAGLGTFFAVARLAASVLGAPSAIPLPVALKDLGIDLGALAVCALVLKRDNEAKNKQLQRISREETLGRLQVELSNGRLVRLEQLRQFARPVIVAGTAEEVQQYMAAAEGSRAALLERGVIAVPVALDNVTPDLPELEEDAKRWRAAPVRLDAWKSWLSAQMADAKVSAGSAVYLSLRMDGRVRGSGKGCPPWERMAVQLPKTEGMWAGMGDGFDGFVGEQ